VLGLPIILSEKPGHCRWRGRGCEEGCGKKTVPLPRKLLEFSISKWRILVDAEVLNSLNLVFEWRPKLIGCYRHHNWV
jgi:hypothetical protein